MMLRRKVFFYAILLVLLTAGAATAGQYRVVDLGVLPGGSSSEATAINASGQVVGYSAGPGLPGIGQRGFLYSNGTMTDLGSLNGGYSHDNDINNNGQVTGWSSANGSAGDQGFVYSNGTMTSIGGFWFCKPNAINNNGQIVGNDGNNTAFLYSNGVMSYWDSVSIWSSCAYDINDSGVMVGQYWITHGPLAFVYKDNTRTDLGTLPDGDSSSAQGINEGGQVVGYSTVAGHTWHAFLYEDIRGMRDLGVPSGFQSSWAEAINDSGQIVGSMGLGSQPGTSPSMQRAFLYSAGIMTDLNTLLEASSSGWTLWSATDINDNGWIVGQGLNPSGETHAYLAIPTPEPSTIILLGLATAVFLGSRFRQRRKTANKA